VAGADSDQKRQQQARKREPELPKHAAINAHGKPPLVQELRTKSVVPFMLATHYKRHKNLRGNNPREFRCRDHPGDRYETIGALW
jgi:hypothetical protein